MIFLRSHDVSSSLAQKIFKRYGDYSIEKLKENPYSISREIFGIGFKTADKLAQNLGIAIDAPQRMIAGVEFTLLSLVDDGHVCYPSDLLIEKSADVLEVDYLHTKTALQELLDCKRVVKGSIDGIELIWLNKSYAAEVEIAKHLRRLEISDCSIRSIHLDQAIDWVQEKLNIQLAQEQKTAVIKSCTEKVHIVTGGPGTGKSTITKAIITITEKNL